MILWEASDLLEATGGRMVRPFAAEGISIDTRTLHPGEMFVALAGEARDGHAFVAAALQRGAAGALVSEVPAGADGTPLLVVDDTLAGLRRMAGYARARCDGRVIAVTGSVGKTTTKEMLRAALAPLGAVHAAEASYNNHWGVPLTLARLPAGAAAAVIEIGMNHPGEIAPLAKLALPQVALITAVEATHIGHMGSLEAIADEKISIARGLLPGGTLILPGDCRMLDRLRAGAPAEAQILTFGAAPEADGRLLEAKSDPEGCSLRARILGREVALRLAAPGRHMAMDAVAALLGAAALDVPPIAAAEALARFVPMAGRGARRTVVVPGGTALLLDESYNASGASVRAALAVLALQPATRRIAVLGDMLELGEAGPAEHQGLAPAVVAGADLLFTCGPLMAGLHAAVPPSLRGAHAETSEELAPLVAAALRPGDAVLVKGSLGSRMKRIVQEIETPATAGKGGAA